MRQLLLTDDADNGLGWLRERPQEGEVLIGKVDGTGQTYVVDEAYWLENADDFKTQGWKLVEETESEATQ